MPNPYTTASDLIDAPGPADAPTPADPVLPALAGQLASGRRYIPNVPVVSHTGERAMFYRDLVERRTVVVHLTSLAAEQAYPTAAYLLRLAQRLEHRLGRDVFLYSITTDPLRDSAEQLGRFAARCGNLPGWLFLTGELAALQAIQGAFFVHSTAAASAQTAVPAPTVLPPIFGSPLAAGHSAAGHSAAGEHDCSLGLLRYGNAAAGLWGSAPVKADPNLMVQRLAWITPQARSRVTATPRRGGPPPLV